MKIALMFSNDELAAQLKTNVERYSTHTVDRYTATVYEESRYDKLNRMADIARNGYDLIQTDELIGNGPFGLVLGKAKSIPVAGYLRGWGDYTNDHAQYGPLQTRKIKAKSKICMRQMDGMAAISTAVIGGITDGYQTSNIEVLERPYNVDYYSNGETGVFDQPTILTVTNLRYAEKLEGVKRTLDGLTEILQETEYQYAIAGDGRQMDDLKAYLEDYPAREHVTLLGYRNDVPSLLASADLFVYLSFLDGRPSTVYEAQAAGLPIVGGDAAGVPEAVGDAGEIVPPTPRGVKRAVNYLIDDAAYRSQLEDASRAKMNAHNQTVTKQWIEFWEGIYDSE